MITLCMDTSHIYLVLGLIRDGEVIDRVQNECWKRQSEEIFPQLIALLERNGLRPEDIGSVVISDGPGSYTGVRIAMTVAKVFCAMKNIPLYTISTLRLYAGGETCRVIMDARGKRVYTCAYVNGVPSEEESVRETAELAIDPAETVTGDGRLVGRQDSWPDIALCFAKTQSAWKKAENVHEVVPDYLKSSDAYMVKK